MWRRLSTRESRREQTKSPNQHTREQTWYNNVCRLVEKLLPLQNQRRLKEWVEQARSGRASGALRGGDEGVIRLMRTVPFSFIQAVLLPGQTTMLDGGVPMIFLMTTQGEGSGLDTSRRVSVGGDLENNMVYCDGCKVVRNWTRWSALVYDHHSRKLLEIFVAFIQSESYEAVSQALAMWIVSGKKGYDSGQGGDKVEPHVVSPKELMLDAGEGAVRAAEEQFAHCRCVGRGIVRSCQFHYGECRIRTEREALPEEWREEHKKRCELVLGAATKEDVEMEAQELGMFYEEKCTSRENRVKMEGWLQYWIQR